MRGRAGLTIVEALIVFVTLTGLWWAFFPRPRRGDFRGTKCQSALRQLALGAIQYADDKRFFPHLRGKRELDGGMETADTPRKMRLLVELGYAEPASFVCAASDDQALPIDGPARADARLWSWGGGDTATVGTAAIVDPTLLETTELSYGWTRAFMNSGVRSTAVLGADRAARKADAFGLPPGLVGNHVNGVNVAQADGTVQWIAADEPLAAQLAGVTTASLPGHVVPPAALTIEPPVLVPGLEPRFVAPDPERLLWLLGPPGALLALLAAGVVVGRRAKAPGGLSLGQSGPSSASR